MKINLKLFYPEWLDYLKKHLFPVILITLFFALMYKIYIPRANAFGCFDDCLNIMGGYFINQGKNIYSDFYFNHQPGMAYLSAVIQLVNKPDSIIEIILNHRQTVWFISLIFSLILYFRFSHKVLPLILLYELSKFYVFGDRFLAESLVAYLIGYQILVILEYLLKKQKCNKDLFLMPIISYTIVFIREPFIPPTIFLLSYFLLIIKKKRDILISMFIFIALSITTVLINSPNDFFFNVITVNQGVFRDDALNIPIYQKMIMIFFYPIYIIISPLSFTILRTFLVFISVAFLIGVIFLIKFKNLKPTIFIFLILGLVNLRPTDANTQFFEAFHSMVFVFSLIAITVFLANYFVNFNRKIGFAMSIMVVLSLILLVSSKNYFPKEKINTHEEFFNNFSFVMDVGTTIRNLSEENDTLFVDGYDDLVIFESKLRSPYKYTWYTSFMPYFSKYKDAREEMFANNPPDFYYGKCLFDKSGRKLNSLENFFKNYRQLSRIGEKNCILINEKKLKKITQEKWHKINKEKYNLKLDS